MLGIRSYLLFLLLALTACEKRKKVIEPWHEGNIALLSIPDASKLKVYRKQFGEREILEGDIQVYVITWMSGERRLRFRDGKLEIEYPIGRTLWQNSFIDEKDTASDRVVTRFANEKDSLPEIRFKTYVIEGVKALYDSLVAMGLDTMKSPTTERWNLHEGKLLIIEYFGPNGLNIFQLPFTWAETDDRYIWIYNRLMPLDPGFAENPGRKSEWDSTWLPRRRVIHLEEKARCSDGIAFTDYPSEYIECQDGELDLERQQEKLVRADADSMLARSIARKDFRFIGVYGMTIEIPGVPDGVGDAWVKEKGAKIISGTSDSMDSANAGITIRGGELAKAYNGKLLAFLKTRPPD